MISTDEVYGSTDEGSWNENAPLLPRRVDPRRCNTYGPYQFPEKIIPRFVTDLLDGRRVPLYGDGSNVRNWLHVDDAWRGIHTVVARGSAGEVFNIGRELTNRELTGLLLDACGAGWNRVEQVADRKPHDHRYSVDRSKIANLGYAPRMPFEQGLAETMTWYGDNRAWCEPLKSR